ncbi:MAG TPA: arginine--tRNA ligase [Solirubrobacterales bacterium]|jgi:arginyl-tRNA synthetase|nr:arginine--tRNA ligase [Solirubrobacterales bacterium]
MGENIFTTFDRVAAGEGGKALWAARAPYRPDPDFDLMLIPRLPKGSDWRESEEAKAALDRLEAESWVASLDREGKQPTLKLADEWIEAQGEAIGSGSFGTREFADIAADNRYAVYFWGANTTKALHIGHLRNLAVGNAIAGALKQAGARVENRSLICDVGRSMGEAMAGVATRSGEDVGPDANEKSDHFVGFCYADYVTASRNGGGGDDGAEDSVARESTQYNDKADEMMMRVLNGDQKALELWSRTRSWVVSGQRKTLARLGITFDRVIYESDYLPEVAEFMNKGLAEGTLTKRWGDDMVMYETEREELEEMPLVRSDGLPTQHMRALAYWAAADELDDVISMQVCGNEWVAHVTCRRKLIDEMGLQNGNGNGSARGGGPPTYDIFHGMVARENESISSSKKGALLIDELVEWLEEELAANPELAQEMKRHPHPEAVPAQVALGYFLLQPTTKQVKFGKEKLLIEGKGSLGWDLARAQAHHASSQINGERPAQDPDYRFAVVQSEHYRVHLRSAVDEFDVAPLSKYLSHFARWYREDERAPEVEAVVQPVLEQGLRGLGLEGA